MEFRKANLEAFQKKYGIKLGFMSVFSKASAYALQDQPVVNAVIDGNVSLLIYNGNYAMIIKMFYCLFVCLFAGNCISRLC